MNNQSFVNTFLEHYSHNANTLVNYRKELTRFVLWADKIRNKLITQFTQLDIDSYIIFYKFPPLDWVCAKGLKKDHPDWKPFSTPKPSNKSLEAMLAILGSFYQWVYQSGEIKLNPLALMRQKSKYLTKTNVVEPIRTLSNTQMEFLFKSIEERCVLLGNLYWERNLFIIRCMYHMYLRISELVPRNEWIPGMSQFYQDSKGRWWFKVLGKGNKERNIVVSNQMLEALKRYRNALKLSEVPSLNEYQFLIPSFGNNGCLQSSRQLEKLIKQCFEIASISLERAGLLEEAKNILQATPHWLRHTGISHDVKIRPREHVRDDAGHASIITTDRYVNIPMEERHASKI